MKTMVEVMEEHYIDITVTSPDNAGVCVCGEWSSGSISISWDEHLADALAAAGFGYIGHYPEPEPCGSYLCDEDHDGRCWTCGELWPCASERAKHKEAS